MDIIAKLKIVLVGDGKTGKTCFVVRWDPTRGYFPEVIPQYAVDCCIETTSAEGKPIIVQLWDSVSPGQHDHLRPLFYLATDTLLICFAVNSRSSFENVRSMWVPELRHHCPHIPLMLVGTKADLRGGERDPSSFVSWEEAQQMAKEIGAATAYFECSALTGQGLKEAVDEAVRVGLSSAVKTYREEHGRRRRNKMCRII